MVSFELFKGKSIVYVLADMFGGEALNLPLVYVVDCLAEEVCAYLFSWCLEEYHGCVVGWLWCGV